MSSNIYQRRSISAGISRSLNAVRIKTRIDNCQIVNLFRDESLEAGYILNILYNLDKLTEMKLNGHQLNGEPLDIEELFMRRFWAEIEKFHVKSEPNKIETQSEIANVDENHEEDDISLSIDLSGKIDALLSMAFDEYTTNINTPSEETPSTTEHTTDCYKIYKRFDHPSF